MRWLVILLLTVPAMGASTVPADYFGLHVQCAAATDPNPNPNSSPPNQSNRNYNPDCGTTLVSFPYIGTAPTPAQPFGLLRFWDNKVKFSQIATTSTQANWFWDTFDYWVGVARTNNQEILYSAGASTPSWACSGACSSPTASSLPTDASWSAFTGAVLGRKLDTVTGLSCSSGATCRPVSCMSTGTWANIYTGCIRIIEVWNEPNTSGSYAGTMAQMVHLANLVKAQRDAITNNAVYVSTPAYTFAGSTIPPTGLCSGMGTSNSPEDYMCSFLQTTSSTPADGVGSAQVDIVGFHPYPATNTLTSIIESTINNRTTGIISAMTANSITLCAHGTAIGTAGCKEMIATEGSWGQVSNGSSIANGFITSGTCAESGGCPRIYPTNDVSATAPQSTCPNTSALTGYGCYDNDQAASIIKYYVLGWTTGMSRNAWYWWGPADAANPWGLIYCLKLNANIGCPTATHLQNGGVAFGTVQTWMTGATMNSACVVSTARYTCDLTLANGHSARIVWDSTIGPGSSSTYSYSDIAFNRTNDMYGNQASASSPATIGFSPVMLELVPQVSTGSGVGGTGGLKGTGGIK